MINKGTLKNSGNIYKFSIPTIFLIPSLFYEIVSNKSLKQERVLCNETKKEKNWLDSIPLRGLPWMGKTQEKK